MSIPITLPWKYNPPGGNINYSIYMQKLCFLYDEKAVPASRSKVQEDKRKWNLPHSGKRHHTKEIINIKTNLHTGYLRKVAKKRGTQISS